MTTNGQAPLCDSVYVPKARRKNEQERDDLAMIIEEVLRQRYEGVKTSRV